MTLSKPVSNFFLLLDSLGVSAEDGPSSIEKWSTSEVLYFLSEVHKCLLSSSIAASEVLRESPKHLVLYPETIFQASDSLLKRCLLYADYVAVPVLFPSPDGMLTGEGLRQQTVWFARRLYKLLPYFRTGIFHPVFVPPTPFNPIVHASAPLVEVLQNPRVIDLVRKNSRFGFRNDVIEAIGKDGVIRAGNLRRIYAEFDHHGSSAMKCEGPPHSTMNIPLISEGPFQVPSAAELAAEPDFEKTLKSVVLARIQSIDHDWKVATGFFGGSLVTGSDITWELINELEVGARQAPQYSTSRALVDLDLPFLDKVPPELVAEERDRIQCDLSALRIAIDTLSLKVSEAAKQGIDQRALNVLRDEIIEEPLRAIDAKLSEVNKTGLYKALGIGVLAASSAAMTVYAGQHPSVASLTTAIAAVVGTTAVKPCVDALTEFLKERATISRSPMNLLWRIKQRT